MLCYIAYLLLPFRLVEKAQLTLSDKELKQKSKQYDSVIDDVINSNNNAAVRAAASSVQAAAVNADSPTASKSQIIESASKYVLDTLGDQTGENLSRCIV